VIKNLKMILDLLNRREKRQLIFVLFALLVMGFIELIGVGSISPFISVVSNPSVIHTNAYLNTIYNYFDFSSDNSFIIAFGVAVIGIIAFSNLCLALVTIIINIFSSKRFYSLGMRFFEKNIRQPYVFYLNINTAELAKKILSDIHTYIKTLTMSLHLVSSTIISLSIIVLLIIINPLLALIVSAILGLSYFIIYSFARNFLSKKGKEKNRQNLLRFKYINETFGGIKDIKIHGKEQVFLDLFSMPSKKYARNDAISEIINEMPKYILETIAINGIVAIIIFLIHFDYKIDGFLPVLTVYAFGSYRLLPSLQKIFRAVANIKFNFPVLKSLCKDDIDLSKNYVPPNKDISKLDFHNNIKLEDILFLYPGTDRPVIKNQILTIKSNTSIALVGHTGCGKTTFVDIILGLLIPQSGRFFVDNVEITKNNLKAWQKNLGYVPQSIYLTDDTIRNNIAFGIIPDKIDNDAVIRAAQLANIHDFIEKELDNGYNTIVGERGVRLSGGQRQRIGIARAVYHDPSVLILDEATSALDSLTENAIMDAIQNMSHKKTIIMIAHRITTIKACDVIYLMDKGEIIDQGSYEELYAKNTLFQKMAEGK
jgi:ABC-type bacteriocin/lantibiotic exporter with double-glycine peptidase domain